MKTKHGKLYKKIALLTLMGLFIYGISLAGNAGKGIITTEIKNPSPMDPESIKRGTEIFINFCSGCHGLRADGKGPQSYHLDPKPKNLRNAHFIQHLTDKRIFFSVSGGVRTTSMPAFELMLFEEQRWDAVNYVRSLTADEKITISNELAHVSVSEKIKNPLKASAKVIEEGKINFMYHCASCHGKKADGKGVTSVNLRPAPRNLVAIRSWGEKSFTSYMDDHWMFDSISNGVPGTSMAPWGAALNTEERWSIITYLRAEAASEKKRMESSGALGGE
jgi:cytochrome c oxidase cbb3-type subunit I/II